MHFLLDANVLIALTDIDHISHATATAWMKQSGRRFATCPITQGALIRFMLRARAGTTIHQAKQFLTQVVSLKGHQFWPDAVSYKDLPEVGVIGHKQVTDAYLVALARHNKGRLATLDHALAALHRDVAVLAR
jgi:toxin-antitoxin system PIN domain toxin